MIVTVVTIGVNIRHNILLSSMSIIDTYMLNINNRFIKINFIFIKLVSVIIGERG